MSETNLDGRSSETVARIGLQSGDRLRREALAAYLETLPAFKIVGRVANHDDVVSLCTLEHPDIMLLDAGDDIAQAVATCRLMQRQCPEVAVVLMYERLSAHEVAQVREAGVDAVLPRAHGLAAVVAVLDRLAASRSFSPPAHSGLSQRQREILLLLASGHSAGEIADLLHISPGTVENHKRRVYAKLNATSAVQAVAKAAAFGIIDGQPATGPFAGMPGGLLSWTSILDNHRPPEAGRTPLAVVAGQRGPDLDRVLHTLIVHRLPVVHDQRPDPVEQAHWLRWNRGPGLRILVNPLPEHWRVAAPGRSTIVVHSGPVDQGAVLAAIRAAGAGGLMLVEHVAEHLVPVLRLVIDGYLVMDRTSSRPFIGAVGIRFAERPLLVPTLTARENDILRSIGRSQTVRQTARSLGLAVKTVENTQGHLFRKLGVRNRAEALAAAYSLGLLEPATGPGSP